MASEDFAVNARVRQLLARHWVRQERLEVGTTDGVVLLKGCLELEPGGAISLEDERSRQRFVQRLRGDIAAIPGVADLVMELHRAEGEACQ